MTTALDPPQLTAIPDPNPVPTPRNRRASFRPRELIKGTFLAIGLVLVALPALFCRLEARFSARYEFFLFCGQFLSLVPGLPGKLLRKCFYHLTLKTCSLTADIGFLTYFHDPRAEVAPHVYIGSSVGLGLVSLGVGVLVGSRASFLSGDRQHQIGPDGKLTHFDRSTATRVHIGAHTWIGEAAIIMANVGPHCIVGAGSIVARPIPQACLVAGVPARLIQKLDLPASPNQP